jgi:hypothetical protein
VFKKRQKPEITHVEYCELELKGRGHFGDLGVDGRKML